MSPLSKPLRSNEYLKSMVLRIAILLFLIPTGAAQPGQDVLIDFEESETVPWQSLEARGSLIEDPLLVLSGAVSLFADTREETGGPWRPFLEIDSAKLRLTDLPTFSVEFDYKVIASPSYFYLDLPGRTDSGFLLTWSGPTDHVDRVEVLFTAESESPWTLRLAMKGSGAIVLDNIRIRQWPDQRQARLALRAARVKPDEIGTELDRNRQELALLETSFSTVQQGAENRRLFEQKLRQTARQLNDLASSIRRDSPTTKNQVGWQLKADAVGKDIFKLKVLVDHAVTTQTSQKISFLAYGDGSLQKIRRDVPYDYRGKSTRRIRLSAAANEHESFQVVVIPLEDLTNLTLSASELQSFGGVISADHFTWNEVGYVPTTKKLYPTEYVGWWPDPLLETRGSDIPASRCVQPFWGTLYIPPDTKPGDYTGTLTVKADNGFQQVFDLTVRVWNFELPLRSALRTSFAARGQADYYLKRGILSEDDPQLPQLGRAYREALLRYRISPCRVGVEPRILLKEDDSIELDFSNYGPELDHYLSMGLNAFTFGFFWGWRSLLDGDNRQRFVVFPECGENAPLHYDGEHYLEEDLWPLLDDNTETIELELFGDEFNRFMGEYFRQWAAYLRSKNCLDLAYCYIFDEPVEQEFETVNRLLSLLRQADAGLKAVIPGIPRAGNKKGDFPDLAIMCPILNRIDYELARELAGEGKESWWYVCLDPRHPYPNFFIDYPAIDHRIIPWMSWKFGLEGLLYYETTGVWRKSNPDPWRDPEAFSTAYGDGFLFYPSREAPVEVIRSIRLEVIRDGIEDYDYFAILRGLVAEAETKKQQLDSDLLETARHLLQVPDMIVATTSSFTDSPSTLLRRRAQLGDCISRLRVALSSH